MMFVILQICYFSYIAEYSVLYFLVHGQSWLNLQIRAIAATLSNVYVILMLTSHSIFVIKYYVIALKISETMKREQDKYISIKVWSVLTIQTLLLFYVVIVSFFIKLDNVEKTRRILYNFTVLPSFVIVIVLAIAFFKLKNSGGM